MKFKLILDPNQEEEIQVYAHAESPLTEALRRLAEGETYPLLGWQEKEFIPLDPEEIYCFFVENNRLYAVMEKERWLVKQRLYQLEPMLPPSCVKLHQSCIANLKKVERFDGSLAGTLRVTFKNGRVDYVSRRQLKQVKERLGL